MKKNYAVRPIGIAWCDGCKEEVLPRRNGTCYWCDHVTKPLRDPFPAVEPKRSAAA